MPKGRLTPTEISQDILSQVFKATSEVLTVLSLLAAANYACN